MPKIYKGDKLYVGDTGKFRTVYLKYESGEYYMTESYSTISEWYSQKKIIVLKTDNATVYGRNGICVCVGRKKHFVDRDAICFIAPWSYTSTDRVIIFLSSDNTINFDSSSDCEYTINKTQTIHEGPFGSEYPTVKAIKDYVNLRGGRETDNVKLSYNSEGKVQLLYNISADTSSLPATGKKGDLFFGIVN